MNFRVEYISHDSRLTIHGSLLMNKNNINLVVSSSTKVLIHRLNPIRNMKFLINMIYMFADGFRAYK